MRYANTAWRQGIMMVVLCLVLIVAVVLWLRSVRHDLFPDYAHQKNVSPDFFGNQVTVSVYDDTTGILTSKLHATSVEHNPVSDNTWLTRPNIWKFDEKNRVRLHAVSDKGQVYPDRKTFRLYEHVVVTQPATPKEAAITLKTNEMTVDTNQNLAETSRPVTITQDGNKVNSTGLKYDYRNNIVELKSKVKGVTRPDF